MTTHFQSAPSDEYYMKLALQEAETAFEKGEVPVGAVIVSQQRVIARAHNQTIMLNDPTAHAEMLAITAAAAYLQGRYLRNCRLYVTLEPCVMCAGATCWAQLGALVYAAEDHKKGYSVYHRGIVHPKTLTSSGTCSRQASELLKKFFKNLR